MKLNFESNISTVNNVENDSKNTAGSVKNLSEGSKMFEAGVRLAQEGRSAEARNLLLRATEADPENESAWLWLASISEYPEELLVFLNSVLKINPHNERALEWAKSTKSLLSKTFVQRGIDASKETHKDFAKQCFLQAIVHDNQNEMAWLWLASVSASEDEKRAYLQKVLEINPQNETALFSLNSLKNQRAEMILQKAVRMAIADDYESALETLQEMPESEDAWVLKAYLVRSFDEKLNCYEKVLELNPENEIAQANLISLLTLMEKAESQGKVSVVQEVESHDSSNTAPQFSDEPAVEVFDLGVVEEHTEPSFLIENQDNKEVAGEIPAGDSALTEDLSQPEMHFADIPSVENVYEPELSPVAPEPEEVRFDSPAADEDSFTNASQNDVELNEKESEDFTVSAYQAEESPKFEYVTEETVPNYYFQPEADTRPTEFEDGLYAGTAAQEQVETGSEVYFEEKEILDYPAPESSNPKEFSSDIYEIETDELSLPDLIQENDDILEFTEAAQNPFPEDVSQFEEIASQETGELITEHLNLNNDEAPKPQMEMECPFCNAANEASAFSCNACRATLSLSDLEMFFAQRETDKEAIGNAVKKLGEVRNERAFTSEELKFLGIGYLNLKNLRKGLNCLKQAVKMNPDDIVFSSQVNALAIRLADIERQESNHDSMPKNRTILVVDDSATVRKLVAGKLEKSGHEVICAVDGVDALEKLQDMIPDLILLDINMPRMDGYQVCKLIRTNETTKDVPVVMISGKDGFFDKVRGRMAGTTGYITKPFGPETLMKTIETYVVQPVE